MLLQYNPPGVHPLPSAAFDLQLLWCMACAAVHLPSVFSGHDWEAPWEQQQRQQSQPPLLPLPAYPVHGCAWVHVNQIECLLFFVAAAACLNHFALHVSALMPVCVHVRCMCQC